MNPYIESLPQISSAHLSLSPLAMFMSADPIVKTILISLIIASIFSWAIIIERAIGIFLLQRRTKKCELELRNMGSLEILQGKVRNLHLPIGRVYDSGVNEWLVSADAPGLDRENFRNRLVATMDDAISNEIDALSGRLSILATIGSVAPFVGLFGTVWGIMRSFIAIAESQNTTLAVVAPGIAEALFATAVGLFTAIPAVIGYNQLSSSIAKVEAKLFSFSVYFQGLMSRHAETTAGR